MILQREIATIAEAKKLLRSTIDKDWALGHFLDAIYSIKEIRETLIFKGGTCLKKCYFPDYRFSEDLDFTSTKADFILTETHLKEICKHVMNHAGIMTFVDSLLPLRYNNMLTGYEANIKFWGADHPRNISPPPPLRWLTKVKFEVILYEMIIFPPTLKNINHPYSDTLSETAKEIPCYSINEILAEKLRALIQRSYTAPRDFYDIWYLTSNYKDLDYSTIVEAFHQKLKYKNYKFEGIHQLINADNDKSLSSAWNNSLAHQVPGDGFPDYLSVRADLLHLFEKIF